jgi:type VI secretion system protein VasG
MLKLVEHPTRLARSFVIVKSILRGCRRSDAPLDRLKTGNTRTPALSPRLPKLVEDAWLLASIECSMKIRSGQFWLLSDDDLGAVGT